jgi:hypothetical protein
MWVSVDFWARLCNTHKSVRTNSRHAAGNEQLKPPSFQICLFTFYKRWPTDGIIQLIGPGINTCCHSVQIDLSPGTLSYRIKFRVYKTLHNTSCFVWVWNSVSHRAQLDDNLTHSIPYFITNFGLPRTHVLHTEQFLNWGPQHYSKFHIVKKSSTFTGLTMKISLPGCEVVQSGTNLPT